MVAPRLAVTALLASCGSVALGELGFHNYLNSPAAPWTDQQWEHDGEKIRVNLQAFHVAGTKAPGSTDSHWERLTNTNQRQGSWANGRIGSHPAIIITKDQMQPNQQTPSPNQQVAVFYAEGLNGRAHGFGGAVLERGGLGSVRASKGSILLSPVKPSGSATSSRRLERGDEDAEELLADDERMLAEDEDEVALLQMGEHMPIQGQLHWGPWSQFAQAGVAPAWTAVADNSIARRNHDLGMDIERSEFDEFPALEVEVADRARPIQFRHANELESTLEPAAESLFFFPWGLSVGASYYSTLPFWWGGHLSKEPHTPTKEEWAVWSQKFESWYWNSLWAWHLMTYWFLVWQMHSYWFVYIYNVPNSPLAKWAEPWIEFWKKLYVTNTAKIKEVYASYTEKLKEAKIPFNPLFPWLPLAGVKHGANLATVPASTATPPPAIVATANDKSAAPSKK